LCTFLQTIFSFSAGSQLSAGEGSAPSATINPAHFLPPSFPTFPVPHTLTVMIQLISSTAHITQLLSLPLLLWSGISLAPMSLTDRPVWKCTQLYNSQIAIADNISAIPGAHSSHSPSRIIETSQLDVPKTGGQQVLSNSGPWQRLETEAAAAGSDAGSRFEFDKWAELPHLLISGTLANPVNAKFSLNQNKV